MIRRNNDNGDFGGYGNGNCGNGEDCGEDLGGYPDMGCCGNYGNNCGGNCGGSGNFNRAGNYNGGK